MSHAERRVNLSGKFGSHSAYIADSGALVVEWYDHGDHAPYESATTLTFDTYQERLLADALAVAAKGHLQTTILAALRDRFQSYFEGTPPVRAA